MANVSESTNVPIQQYPTYGNNFIQPENSVMYQQPCLMYTGLPYGVSVAYDNPVDQQISDIPGYYVNVSDAASASTSTIPYQGSHPMWGQQNVGFFPNSAQPNPAHRFALPNQTQPGMLVI